MRTWRWGAGRAPGLQELLAGEYVRLHLRSTKTFSRLPSPHACSKDAVQCRARALAQAQAWQSRQAHLVEVHGRGTRNHHVVSMAN